MPYQMPNGKWRAKRMIQGQTRTKTFATKREAARWEGEQSVLRWTEAETQTVTVLEWLNRYLDFASLRYARVTMLRKQLAARRCVKALGKRTIAHELTTAHATAVLDAVLRESTPGAANEARKELSAAWMWGVKNMGLPRANPFRDADKAPQDKAPRYVPTPDEYARVYNAMQPRSRLLLMAALHTAARRGELLLLTWADVDFAAGTIRLGTRKRKGGGMHYSLVPMTPTLADALGEEAQHKRGLYVFCTRDGEPYKYRTNLVQRACERAGVRRFGLHAVRHLSATMLARAGVDLLTIKAILRHAKATTTDLYLHELLGVGQDVSGAFDEISFDGGRARLAHGLAHAPLKAAKVSAMHRR